MSKGLTEIIYILDRSGSMAGLEADTIGGFNSMMEKQKKTGERALVSTVLFDNVSEVIHDRVPIDKIEKMTDEQYFVGDVRRFSMRLAGQSIISGMCINMQGRKIGLIRLSSSLQRMEWKMPAAGTRARRLRKWLSASRKNLVGSLFSSERILTHTLKQASLE